MFNSILSFFNPIKEGLDPFIFSGAEEITQIVGNNIITISLGLIILKWIAKKTPWAGDDKIHQILTGLFQLIKSGNLTPGTIEKFVDNQIEKEKK